MKLEDFDFHLPKHLVAQSPCYPRDASKLLYIDNKTGFANKGTFSNIKQIITKKDVLVLNDTKVIPALLNGIKISNKGSKKKISLNLLDNIDDNQYSAMLKPAKYVEVGDKIFLSNDFFGTILFKDTSSGYVKIKFNQSNESAIKNIEKIGSMPLPPYIKRNNNHDDVNDYQTIYAKNKGAVAAPTAGLHFTNELLDSLKANGVKIAYVTLHVSGGTFLPVKSENINDHKMYEENYIIDKKACELINDTKSSGGRVICVGTTSLRVLETVSNEHGYLKPTQSKTAIFIKPGYKFKITDSLITNFHLPKSTLFMLVCALAGAITMKNAYSYAIKNEYRFFSYGDACFINRYSG